MSEYGAIIKRRMKNCDLIFYNQLEKEIWEHTYDPNKWIEFDP